MASRIDETRAGIKNAMNDLKIEVKRDKAQNDIIPRVENVLKLYKKTYLPAHKSHLLKSILDYASYRKEKVQTDDDFTLILYPKYSK